MIRFIRIGAEICKRNLSIILVSFLFVLVDRTFSLSTPPGEFKAPIDVLRLVFKWLQEPQVLVVLILGICVKACVIVGTTADMFRLRHPASTRLTSIVKTAFSRDVIKYCAINVAWYSIFFLIGTVSILSSEWLSLAASWAWIVCGALAIVLFPIFYSGFSVIGFFFAVRNVNEEIPARDFIDRIARYWRAVYAFYTLRSFLDLLGVGMAMLSYRFLAPTNTLLANVSEFVIMAVVIGVLRTASLVYKLDLFGLRRSLVRVD